MNALQNAIDRICRHLQGNAKQIIVAYSGGVDSHVLLQIVASLRADYPQHNYLAVHINHGLQDASQDWLKHCEQQCEKLGMPFKGIQVQIDKNSKKGIEAAAREQRYQALTNCAEHGAMIFLGQHLDDQAETVLLQLKRGSGPKGLSAMPDIHQHHSGVNFVRPLLQLSRSELEAFASKNQLQWVEDPSNQDCRYDRNFLRQQIMPLLSKRWPGFSQAVARSAALNAQQQTLLDEVCDERLQSIVEEDVALNIDSLSVYSLAWQHQLVRTWLDSQFIPMPSKAVLDELASLLNAKQDAEPILQWQDWQFRRFRNKLHCIKVQSPLSTKARVHCENQKITHPNGMGEIHFSRRLMEKVDSIVALKSVFSSKFKPQESAYSKPLKQWFKLWEIPPWLREQSLTVLFDDVPVAIWVGDKIFFSIDMPTELIMHVQWQLQEPAL